MSYHRFKFGLLQSFNFVFVFVFGYIFLNTIIYPVDYFIKYNQLIVIIGASLVLGIMLIVNNYLGKLTPKYLTWISGLSFISLFAAQLFCAHYFKVNPTWDFGEVYYEALALSERFRPLSPYFYSYCPNNLPILFILTGLMKAFRILGVTDLLTPLIGVNLIVVWLSIYVMYLLIKELYGLKYATLFSLFSLMVTPLYLYTTIIYTDTIGMMFPVLSLYLYAKIYKSECYDWKKVTLLGIVLGISALIKTHAVIVLIAIIIHYVMNNRAYFIKLSVQLIGLVLIVLLGYKLLTKPLIPIASEEVGFPKTHWIMMGLKGTGGFDDEDTDMTRYLKDIGYTNEQIQNEHLRIMKERIDEFGWRGLMNHLNNKLNFTWSDGTYFAPEKLNREPLSENIFQTYIFGSYNKAYLYFSQMIHVAVQFLVLLSSIKILKQKSGFESVATISLFGVILFLLIWETRSRYLMIYLPVIIFLASHGFTFLSDELEKIKRQ